jgi:threonine dehydratase
MTMITLDDIRAAQQRIRGVALHTPLLPFSTLNPQQQLFLKPENFQPIGAFKIRGAYNAIACLSNEERECGVIAHSSGNHAQAVAYSARALGCKAVIVMPQNAPSVKLNKTREYGAEVVVVGNASNERVAKAEELQAQHGYIPIPPYDHKQVIAGQGTLALEVLQDLPEVGLVLAPVSGGGLISGVAAALKLSKPSVKVIGVEPELAGDACASLRQGRVVSFSAEQVSRTIADGLRVQQLGKITWPHVQAFVDDIVTVSEDEIRDAMRVLAWEAKLVAEPSGAVTFAAWLHHRQRLPAAKFSVAILSGGNVEPGQFAEIVNAQVTPHNF